MSKLSELLAHLGRTGQILNEDGKAIIPVLVASVEPAIEAGINANLAKNGLAEFEKPLDDLFEGIVEKIEPKP